MLSVRCICHGPDRLLFVLWADGHHWQDVEVCLN